jgi:hypothetical protein
MSVSAAKSRVMQVRSMLESNRLGEVEATMAAAEKFLEGLPDGETVAIRAELAALRAQLAAMPTPEETQNLSAAKGKIRQARSQLADRQVLGVDATVATAKRHLLAVREAHRGAVATDLAALEAEIAALLPAAPAATSARPDDRAGAGSVAPATPAVAATSAAAATPAAAPAHAARAADAPLTDDEHADLSRGRSRVAQARNAVETGRLENVEPALDAAIAFLDKVPASATAALHAQIAEIRRQAAAAGRGEDNRRARSELDRHLRRADSDISTHSFGSAASALDHVTQRLGEDDVTGALSSEEIVLYRDQVGTVRAALAAAIKADALDRAIPLVEELEGMVATDPLAGLDQAAAYAAVQDVSRLRVRILGAIQAVPGDDAQIRALVQRVAAAEQLVDKASAAWGKAQLDAAVSSSWSSIERDIAGWDAEPMPEDVSQLHEPDLPRTRAAIQRIRYLLEDPKTLRIRGEHRGDPAVDGPYQAAERVLAAAGARLHEAYSRILDAAERLDTPLNRFILDRPALLAYGAESALAGTTHLETVVARARALDARWKAEVATIMRARQELFDTLAAEAETTWPRVRDATGAVPFDPAAARPGTIVRLDGIYNRAGWDYSGRAFHFAASVRGVVFAGTYEPHVLAALEHAWYEQKLDVSDRFPWDLVGVVDGPGHIGVRTTVTLRDATTNLELGTLEDWPPTDCLRIRIIALHAGPVAVGPGR